MSNDGLRFLTNNWQQFEEEGYLRLGKVLSQEELRFLGKRIDEIMLGKAEVEYESLLMQREASEGYEQSAQTNGFKGSTLNYRKIQNLEFDPYFLTYMQKDLFKQICAKVYGFTARISCFRAMFMNKPARHGSALTYHQDRWKELDRDPLVTVWTALDESTKENGCMHIFPGTHRNLINPDHPSGFLTAEQLGQLANKTEPIALEADAGEAVLIHNWTVHGSGGNSTEFPRRAFSVCYMDADSVSSRNTRFPVVFGEGALQPYRLTWK
jgi:ectoine hydroxylase-related dioxygenase (phytanoyl-CoA dioxygenase family)